MLIMRIASSTPTLALQPSAYALSDVGARTWSLLPAASGTGHVHAFDANLIFRCRLTGRYTPGLSLNAVCSNGYATVHQHAESHVDMVSHGLAGDAWNDAAHRVHAVNDGIDWQ
jgi:hypothetical protein